MPVLASVDFYHLILAVHILGVIAAFGGTLLVPVVGGYLRLHRPAALPSYHGAVAHVGRTVATPAMVVVLLAGIYLAADRSLFSEAWVSISILILIVLLGLYGALIIPRSARLAAGGGSDPGGAATGGARTAAGGSAAHPPADVTATTALLARVHALAIVLVVIAVLLMTLQP